MENIINKIKQIDIELEFLKKERSILKAQLPKKKVEINYVYFDATVRDISFGTDYYVDPIEPRDDCLPYTTARISSVERKWKKSEKPKVGDKVKCRMRLIKSGWNKIDILNKI